MPADVPSFWKRTEPGAVWPPPRTSVDDARDLLARQQRREAVAKAVGEPPAPAELDHTPVDERPLPPDPEPDRPQTDDDDDLAALEVDPAAPVEANDPPPVVDEPAAELEVPVGQRRHHPQAGADWEAVRARYVEGIRGPDGAVEWPTVAAAAEHYGATVSSARTRASKEGWTEQRRRYQAQVEEARRRAKLHGIAAAGARLDSKALDVGQLGLQLVYAKETEIAQLAQQARTTNPGSSKSGISANELQKLAAAAELFHRIGLRALGDTDVTRVEVTGAGGRPIEISQELRRDDPQRLADVVHVLKGLGVEDLLSGGGDVVDGEVAEDVHADGAGSA